MAVESNQNLTPLPITLWGPLTKKVLRGIGFRHLAMGVALMLAVQGLYGLGIMWYFATHTSTVDLAKSVNDFLSSSGVGVLGGLLSLWLAMLVTVFVASRSESSSLKALTGGWFRWKYDLALALGMTIGIQGISLLVQSLVQLLPNAPSEDLGNTAIVTDVLGSWKWVIAACAVLGAPIVEELFFRGFVLTLLVRKWGKALGVLGSSLFFGLMHVQATVASSVFTVTTTAIVGALLALIKLRTGRIGASIVAHIVFNLTGVIAAFLLT